MRAERRHRAAGVAIVVLVLASAGATAGADGTRATMRDIFDAIAVAFPLSLEQSAYRAPANRPRVTGALRALTAGAAELAGHGADLDRSYDLLRRSLAADAREVLDTYRLGRYETSAFLLQQLTGACFACHSKLPSEQRFPLGARLLEPPAVQALPPAERARLAVAARQFDTALAGYEAFFDAYPAGSGDTDLLVAVEEYLKVALRVRGSLARPAGMLHSLAERADLAPHARAEVARWSEALGELRRREPEAEPLAEARALIRAARARSEYPADPRGLVHYMAASSHLHRFIAAEPQDVHALAEAFHLLGVAESHFASAYWLPEATSFLETAIRLVPGTERARQAYTALERHVTTAYTGSSGLHLPADVRAHLDELRALAAGTPSS